MKHLWNVEKGSSGERVVTSSEGHSLFEGPLQGTSLRNQLLSPSSPSFDLVLGSHWLNPTRSQRKKSRIRGVNEDTEPRMTSRTQAVLILERNLLPKMRLASFLKEEELGISLPPAPVVSLLPC